MILTTSKVLKVEINDFKTCATVSLKCAKYVITQFIVNADKDLLSNIDIQTNRHSNEKLTKYGIEYIKPSWMTSKAITDGLYEVQMVPMNQGGRQAVGINVSTATVSEDGAMGIAVQLRPNQISQGELATITGFLDNERSFIPLSQVDTNETMLSDNVAYDLTIKASPAAWSTIISDSYILDKALADDIVDALYKLNPILFGDLHKESKDEVEAKKEEAPKKSSIILGL